MPIASLVSVARDCGSRNKTIQRVDLLFDLLVSPDDASQQLAVGQAAQELETGIRFGIQFDQAVFGSALVPIHFPQAIGGLLDAP
ncbi:hypothetical protein [Mycolicibacterium sp. lyk4-40-TYG-92]|uniref:hypothetical protein n=1 Tax=Mycolicibacterium sp. lyk4-40-TYG-92 TaxID=3040295 RepID=UPI00254BC9BC|nr:hypothetical protein [Mycolicibacterium sp. lyk4-40-TYG-92]